MLKKYVNSDFVSLFDDNNLDTDLITDIDEFVKGFIKTTFNNSIKNFNVVYKLIISFFFAFISFHLDIQSKRTIN